jgi:hypothetical protein
MLLRKKGMVDMQNMLAQFCMNQLGFGPLGEIMLLTPGIGNAHNYFRDKVNEANLFSSIQKGYAAAVTARNDIILVTPDNHTWKGDAGVVTAELSWDKQNVHLLGLSPENLSGYGRARFSHSSTMVSMLDVGGSGNIFKNIRLMHGSASAGDITCLTVSGAGNSFENCGFATPINNTQSAASAYRGIIINGTQNYFKRCTFGTANDVDRSAANAILQFATTCSGWNVFEDCVFRSRSGGGQTTAIFIDDACTATVVDYTGIFLNCKFLHQGADLAVGITKAVNSSRKLFFDSRCTFAGVTNLVTAGQEASILWGQGGAGPDVSNPYDNKGVGLAAIAAT